METSQQTEQTEQARADALQEKGREILAGLKEKLGEDAAAVLAVHVEDMAVIVNNLAPNDYVNTIVAMVRDVGAQYQVATGKLAEEDPFRVGMSALVAAYAGNAETLKAALAEAKQEGGDGTH